MPDPIIIHHRRAAPPLSTRATHQHNAMSIHMTAILHPAKDEPINQAFACLAFAGAVTLAPGTYVVDNRPEYATTKADD